MASPQWEIDGYVKVARPIMEALTRTRIPGEARQCLDFIIIKTYGFHKKEDAISLSQFSLSTGLNKPAVCRAITKLIALNLVIKKDNGYITKYRFNKDFDTWKPLSKKITLSKKIICIIEKDNLYYRKRDLQKKLLQKKLLQKKKSSPNPRTSTYSDIFEKIWKRYKSPVGKKAAYASFKASVHTEQDYADINKALDNYYAHLALEVNKYKPLQNGSTWFNNWRDWVDWVEPVSAQVEQDKAARRKQVIAGIRNLEGQQAQGADYGAEIAKLKAELSAMGD